MNLLVLVDLFSILITFICLPSHPVNSFWFLYIILFTDFFDSFFMHYSQHFLSHFISFLQKQKIIKSTSKPINLHIVQEKFVETSHKLPSNSLSIKFSERMNKAVIRFRPHLILINDSFQKLAIQKYNLVFLFISFQIVFRYLCV